MYVCLGGLAIILPILLVTSLYKAGVHPLGELLARFRKLPPLTRIIALVVTAQLIVYGSTKPQPMLLSWTGEETLSSPTFTDDQLAAQAAIVSCRTNETWSFAPHEDARIIEPWSLRGAAHERVSLACSHPDGSAIEMDTYGRVWTGTKVYSPLGCQLGMVPEARWEAIGRESLGWWQTTASNTTIVTWQNALLNRDTNTPVSVQAEFFPDGRFVYRYDLSSIGSEATNLCAQVVSTNGIERIALVSGVTSVNGHLLREEYASVTDSDGDGIATYDEIFFYGTDPERPDTDGDGLIDGDEIANETNPLIRDVSDAEILARIANGVSHETIEIIPGELTSTKLWDGFILDGDMGTNTLYTRTFLVDRQGGWTTYYLSARGESGCADAASAIHDWSLTGVEILWADNVGLSGTLTASPRNDSCYLPISPNATSVTVTLRGLSGEERHASEQPLYLLTHTPKVVFPGGQEITGADGNTYCVLTDSSSRTYSINRTNRPCRATLFEDERTDEDFQMPWGTGVYSLPLTTRVGGRSVTHGSRYLVILSPWVTYGSAHYECRHDFPYNCSWFGWSCTCEAECGSGVFGHSAVESYIDWDDGTWARAIVKVAGVEVWREWAHHSVSICDHKEEVESEPICPCECESDCPYCLCLRVDGPSLGSIRFRLSLGDMSDGNIAGFAWFESNGPVYITPSLFEVDANPNTVVDKTWSGWDLYITTHEWDGKNLVIAETSNGVAISIRCRGVLLETWEIENIEGNSSEIRFMKHDTEGVLLEDWICSCVWQAGEWKWTKIDNRPRSPASHPPTMRQENGTNWIYSVDGRLERLTVGKNENETIIRTFSYDTTNRLALIDDRTNGCVSIAYDADGNIASMTGPEGTLAGAWDASGSLTNLDTSAWNGSVPLMRTEIEPRSGGNAGGAMTPAEALQHYLNGGGMAVTMPFDVIDTSWLKPTDFEVVKNFISICHAPGTYTLSGTKSVPATGYQRLYLGDVTVRLEGTITYLGSCSWSFSGTMTGLDDTYDFNAANRGFAGEALTFIGRLLFSAHGTPYAIKFSGSAPLTGTGHCGD